SLSWHYASQFSSNSSSPSQENPEAWTTTPQNYLEKIFQLPLAIPQMQSQGFEALVDTLLDVRPTEPQTTERSDGVVDSVAETTTTEESTRTPPSSTVVPPSTPPSVELQLERLQIWPAGLKFLRTLAPLLSTPRAAT